MLLNQLMPMVYKEITIEQAGSRSGKSCISQILNLTPNFENGFDHKQITGVAFVDLSVPYDTVNNNIMLTKLDDITHNYNFIKTIEALLSNRRYFVTLYRKNSQ